MIQVKLQSLPRDGSYGDIVQLEPLPEVVVLDAAADNPLVIAVDSHKILFECGKIAAIKRIIPLQQILNPEQARDKKSVFSVCRHGQCRHQTPGRSNRPEATSPSSTDQ